MIRFSIHLPTKLRLDIRLVKNRKNLDEKPLVPPMGKIIRVKAGSKISRFFRHLFENSRIKKIIGTNLILMFAISTFLPRPVTGTEYDEIDVVKTSLVTTTEKSVQYPVNSIQVTQGYHFYHPGIDFDGETGDSIKPIMAGRVKTVEYSIFGYGKSIVIVHGAGIESRYAHLSKIDVKEGQEVTKDTKIGEMGATGRAFGDHLHLEVYDNGKTINPLDILID